MKVLKSENIDIKKELAKSDLKIKTMKKEAEESVTQHNKILKKKDETIENLQHFKTLKNSEERELQIKEKKINIKLKFIESLCWGDIGKKSVYL